MEETERIEFGDVHLSPRQRELYGHLINSKISLKEIGFRMGITEGTVKMMCTHLFAKLGTNKELCRGRIALLIEHQKRAGILGAKAYRDYSYPDSGAATPNIPAPPKADRSYWQDPDTARIRAVAWAMFTRDIATVGDATPEEIEAARAFLSACGLSTNSAKAQKAAA